MATTRRLLERVPSDKGEWKPHAKSFALGHLAQLVARMPGWITMTIRQPDLNLAAGGGSGNWHGAGANGGCSGRWEAERR